MELSDPHGTSGLTQHQLDAYWMPYTGNRQFKSDPRIFVEAQGCYYRDAQGRQIFDGLSGLWTCGLGHGPSLWRDGATNARCPGQGL